MGAPEDLLDPSLPTWRVQDTTPAAVLASADPTALTLVIGVRGPGPDAATAAVVAASGADPDAVLAAHEPSGSAGEVTMLPLPPGRYAARRLLLVGLGSRDADDLRTAGAAVGRATRGVGEVVLAQDSAELGEGPDGEAGLAAYVEGAVLGGWAPPRWTRGGVTAGAEPAGAMTLVGGHDAEVVRRAVTRARATLVARALAVVPSNIKNPPWLAAQAETLARRSGLGVTIRTENELRAEGFGGHLAVGAGSVTPPRLVRLDYRPQGRALRRGRVRHVVLVGKGITFDSGGLQVKPAAGMLAMKSDMSGAGIVLAVLGACRDLGVPVRVTGLLALAENAVDGASYRPGDVITQYGGTTVEVGNTDAEGRLVLADALAYADSDLDPDAVVDIATLTGAARVALARELAPLYTTDDALRDALMAAGGTTGETLWPMPLTADYRRELDSDVADINHIARGWPGSIIAALFLREFVGDRAWAHLDIAGTGRSDVDAGILAKGGTGFGTRLLLRWLEGQG